MTAKEKRLLGALALGAVAAFTVAGCTGLGVQTSTVHDGQPITQPVTAIRLDMAVGEVHVRVEPGAPTSFRRDLTYHVKNPGPTHRVENGTLVLAGCGGDCGVNYDVVVGADLPILGHLGTGKVTVEGAAKVELNHEVGDTTVLRVDGPVQVTTATGNVEIGLAKPDNVRADLQVGELTVTVPKASYQVNPKAGTGQANVDFASDPAAPHHLDLTTGTGKITVHGA
ncbi:hypothetical protein [Amycolatopsis sp. H20-H5]|uniref:hypothetical protein n=1 Tax=Amycolatopsis sp. H20-H5 TaxID=3046309 RepID=UPI002DB6FAC4|nr:hypothetical protein [Amycolatopsis sp. H20-H5]MEC3975615.1 hypothetical protein [Amycolatopsis sp. H20-H5]